MKVLIVGAGAIGGLLGGSLAQAGHDVNLVARGETLAALRTHGLRLRSGANVATFRLPAAEDPSQLGLQDAVFIALKAHAIGPMLPRIVPALRAETPVVTAINGLPWWYFYREGGAFDGQPIRCLDREGTLDTALDSGHLVGCVVHAAAEVTEPGVVHHTGGRGFILGELDGAISPRLRALCAALESAGLAPSLSTRIRDDIWTKLIGNLSYNPVAALTGALMNEINDNPALIALIRRMMVEAIEVGEAYGARFTVSIEERLGMARKLGSAKISMLQDLERGRPLETDAIVAAVVELARRKDLATPTIDGVLALLRERERHVMPR